MALALGGDPARVMAAPKHALQRKLLDGLRYLLREEFKLNQPGGPSDGWLTPEALWLVSKTVSDKLRAHLLSQGIEGIPSNNTAVFSVLQDHGIVQPAPDGKAIWRATVTSGTGWSHSFTFLRLSPALIWESGERPAPFAGTVTTEEPLPGDEAAPASAGIAATSPPPGVEDPQAGLADLVSDLLSMLDASAAAPATVTHSALNGPATMPAPAKAMPSGEDFIAWLKQGIESRKLIINDAKALVHTVDGTAYLVSPGAFQRYVQKHPEIQVLARQDNLHDWQWVQKRFEKLGLHRKQDSGLNIWTCEVTGPRKSRQLHGYLLAAPSALFAEVPPDNPYLSLARNSAPPGTTHARCLRPDD